MSIFTTTQSKGQDILSERGHSQKFTGHTDSFSRKKTAIDKYIQAKNSAFLWYEKRQRWDGAERRQTGPSCSLIQSVCETVLEYRVV